MIYPSLIFKPLQNPREKEEMFHCLLFNLLATNHVVIICKGNAEKWVGEKMCILDTVFKNLICLLFFPIVYKIWSENLRLIHISLQ